MHTSHTAAAGPAVLAMIASLMICAPAQAQAPLPTKPISHSGPRFGVTYLSDGIVDKLRDEGIDVSPAITQFGWQFEKQFNTTGRGPLLVTEWVLLAGGAEQGLFLPSLSWLTGARTRGGIEFGVGPNLSAAGVALVATAGRTFRAGDVNIPVNFAVVPSKANWASYGGPPAFRVTEIERRALRVSLLFGFNTRR